MIRLIGRRLIIPQGDTGTFTIPTQGEVSSGDKAILSVYDNLTHKTIIEKKIDATSNTLEFQFESNDTLIAKDGEPIEPDDRGSRYSWDVTILRNPLYDENEGTLMHADDIDSYYAAFSLPPCVIKRVTRNV